MNDKVFHSQDRREIQRGEQVREMLKRIQEMTPPPMPQQDMGMPPGQGMMPPMMNGPRMLPSEAQQIFNEAQPWQQGLDYERMVQDMIRAKMEGRGMPMNTPFYPDLEEGAMMVPGPPGDMMPRQIREPVGGWDPNSSMSRLEGMMGRAFPPGMWGQ